MKFRVPKFTPVFFHNLSGYDAHLFVKNLGVTEGDIRCIPNNEEKYISFSKNIKVEKITKKGEEILVDHEIRLLDSFKFMACALGTLLDNLDKSINCKNLRKFYKREKFGLLKRKGVYPYDYVDSLEKLSDKQLPSKEEFYSRLNNTEIKNFRDMCMSNYELDPCWYYTSPGLSWDALLKTTNIYLENITDLDMYLFFEKGTRGGISIITTRYGEANNPYMGDEYDPEKPTKYITYLDANNLYGWAMSKPLPTRGFKWMEEEELNNWRNVPCTVEVHLEYPKELHDAHNEYRIAAEKLVVGKVEKLIPNLNDKTKYVGNHRALKCYEKHGIKVTKVHRGIKYQERSWMKEYIDLNTKLRATAKNDFEKDLFKLMNNSVFGKTMENVRNRVNIRLVTSRHIANKLAIKPTSTRTRYSVKILLLST